MSSHHRQPRRRPQRWRLLCFGLPGLALTVAAVAAGMQVTALSSQLSLGAIAAWSLSLTILLSLGCPWRLRPILRWVWRLTALSAIILAVGAYLAPRPEYADKTTSSVESCWLSTPDSSARVRWQNWIPESDQLRVAFAVQSLLHRDTPLTTAHQSVLARYDTPPSAKDNSILAQIPAQLVDDSTTLNHYRIVRPTPDSPSAGILVLHDTGGNVQGYAGLLQPLLKRQALTALLPSGGWGEWHSGGEHCWRVVEDARKREQINDEPVWILGIGTGARAAVDLLDTHGSEIQGILLLCPVLDDARLQAANRSGAWIDRPLSVIYGQKDWRTPPNRSIAVYERLCAAGAQGTIHSLYDADGWLPWTHAQDWQFMASEWMPGALEAPPPRPRGRVLLVADDHLILELPKEGEMVPGDVIAMQRGDEFMGRAEIVSIADGTAEAKALPGLFAPQAKDAVIQLQHRATTHKRSTP